MAKKLSEIYAPKSPASKDFVAKHTIKKTTDKSPATKDDARFTGSNVKTFQRKVHRFGYDVGDDEKAYGVGGDTPGQFDSNPPPPNGSAVYPSGKFKEETELGEAEHKITASARTYNKEKGTWHIVDKELNIKAKSRKHAINKALKKIESDHPDHEEYHAQIHESEDNIEEANLINKQKKNEYVAKVGKEKAERKNVTAAKRAGRAELRKEDIEINDENIDLLIDLIDEYMLTKETE